MRTAMHLFTLNAMQLVCGGMLCFAAGGLVTLVADTALQVTTECTVTAPASPLSDEPMKRFMSPGLLPMDQGERF